MVKKNNADKNIVHKVLLYVMKSFGSPLTLVTFFGPIIVLQLSFLYLKENLRGNNDEYYQPLKAMVIDNPWTEPMADFNVQFIVLIIVFVFAVYEVMANFYGLIKEHTIQEVRLKILSDFATMTFVMITIIFILIGGGCLILGIFSSPENIRMFKENAEYYALKGWRIHPPPLQSNIFWARVLIIFLYSPISNYLIRRKLPIIFINNAKQA
jgi:hypothetical protein